MPELPSCPDPRDLRLLHLGQSDGSEAGALRRHLEECPRCVQVMEELKAEKTVNVRRLPQSKELPLPPIPFSAGPNPDAAVPPAPPKPGDATQAVVSLLGPPQEPDEIGRLGPYRVLRVLGTGATGVVFQAQDSKLRRMVALKAIKPNPEGGEMARQRFLREGRAAAAIEHDHVVTVYQVDEDRGIPYLAMQLLQGETLDSRLKREGRLPIPEVLRIGREIAEGLAAAHDQGQIHRDIKPANIWLESRAGLVPVPPRVKILDFGLARVASEELQLTRTGTILGTPAYMAPEQARGSDYDHRCDLFSLGCVLYRMCTGQAPFQAEDTVSMLLAVACDEPRPILTLNPDVPPPLVGVVSRLLAKHPDGRPSTARHVASLLADIEQVVALQAATPKKAALGLTSPAGKTGSPWPWVAAVLVLGLAALAWIFYGGDLVLYAGNKGLVLVSTVDATVKVTIKQHGEMIAERDARREIELPPGDYEIELADPHKGLRLSENQFTLKRGERLTVRVISDRRGGP